MSACLFCDIVEGKIPCTEVHADENFLAFRDIDPKAPTHVLVIPRRHIGSLATLADGDRDTMGGLIMTAKAIATQLGLDDRGYRFVLNCGEEGGQTVGHIHLHLLGGRSLQWPPG